VTHRDLASSFTVVTGHENPNKPESSVDYPAVVAAAQAGTLILLMGATHLEQIVAELLLAGHEPTCPAAGIESGTTSSQRVVTGTLETIVQLSRTADLKSPALFVIGEVVRLSPEYRSQGG
jgi:siroheme synthase